RPVAPGLDAARAARGVSRATLSDVGRGARPQSARALWPRAQEEDRDALTRRAHEGGAPLRARAATETAADGRALHGDGRAGQGRSGTRTSRVRRERGMDGVAVVA